MRIIRSIASMTLFSKKLHLKGKFIGFVPTMGALHAGHLSLIRKARKENDCVVVSIFVNPLQFGPKEDYKRYPRDINRDIQLCLQNKVDVIFYPDVATMYPKGFCTYIEVEGLSDVLCGRFRPGHFRGVTTVVAKLFHIVQPDYAYFGQKDAQQALIIERMVKDLNFSLQVKVLPTIREPDGLAMSSRNTYLNPKERIAARVLSEALKKARFLYQNGVTESGKIKSAMLKIIQKENLARPQYIEIVDQVNLQPVKKVQKGNLVALAVWIGKTRLIDNTVI